MRQFGVRLQSFFSHLFVPFSFGIGFVLLRLVGGYKWENLTAFRAKLHTLVDAGRPLILCPNHLTMIDSMLLMWAIAEPWRALVDPRWYPWNTPLKRNFIGSATLRFYCYIGKCLPVVRGETGDKAKSFLGKLQYLLSARQSLMMFPEGTRSVSGRVDTENYTYGIGKLIDDARRAGVRPQVVCLYMRGRRQKAKSTVPPRGDRFYLDAEKLEPVSAFSGLRAARDISGQIIQSLARLEREYFAR